MKMTHKQKLHLARKLRTQREIKLHIPPFSCKGWLARKPITFKIIEVKWYRRLLNWIKGLFQRS